MSCLRERVALGALGFRAVDEAEATGDGAALAGAWARAEHPRVT